MNVPRKMRICGFTLIICILSIPTHTAAAENILILPGMETGSHFLFMKIVGKALLDRGHYVTFILGEDHVNDLNHAFSVQRFTTNVTVQTWKTFWNNLAIANSRGEHIHPLSYNNSQMKTLVYDGCHAILRDSTFMNNLKTSPTNYSVIIGDILNPCAPILSLYLSIPLVEVATGSITANLVYLSTHTVDASFFPTDSRRPTVAPLHIHQHALKSTRILIATLHYQRAVLTNFDNLKSKYNIRSDISIYTAMSRAKLWLFNIDTSLEVGRPSMPNSVFVGGITAKEPKSLPKDMEKFMLNSGDKGVVVVSLGSYFNDMDKQISDIWASAFGRLDQKVFWSYSGTPPSTLGDNTLLVKSIPQNDILGHYKTKLFVTHAGLNGVYEAIYHAVPMVCIPFSGDQFNNAKRVTMRDLGIRIEAHGLTSDILYNAMIEVLENPKYKIEIRYRSEILKGKNMPAPQRAAFWIEHVAKQGYNDENESALHNLWDKYMLSLWLRLVFIVILVVIATLFIIKCFIMSCRRVYRYNIFRSLRRRLAARRAIKYSP
ncbi:UDP-glucuronosyltransferase 1-2-like [Anneissia japonica]|uniref:UDP-glucuronosyltransferase 1-2-like n=1 Tax=Anneissia japonica TaxID=1529436 RepID=UPI0014255914|nr:UDP-glucuronosyltransferase 1-2-like [Anneissia japonica]XP_033111231.1 UDP-glucuronosyltransferase 1-2-like [Anneissia japonica]XP_033111234.1 UDP-glucuronosyltransferase 1-2-like [Anneissia japonica]XP_033111241.1 UDP-glucuronosyltransferase 1-2-like [Anneissia japonica]XP_033111244.1 UDP-glucuronosyltransferase 1-2-like [Anneissia japonica]XP_033111251.1 UDP-glucuronosyltransferase 1-2-like [Anneissia japonica]XP_033111258.1 UDP-glucuronosyltransferase 1-2-like [Anneissia japonica]XP_0